VSAHAPSLLEPCESRRCQSALDSLRQDRNWRRETQALGPRDLVFAPRIASSCRCEQLLGRVDSNNRDAFRSEHPAKSSFPAAYVERTFESLRRGAFEHSRIKHMFSAPVALHAHCGNPRARRTVPTIVHESTPAVRAVLPMPPKIPTLLLTSASDRGGSFQPEDHTLRDRGPFWRRTGE
jgi:hypothetical protein